MGKAWSPRTPIVNSRPDTNFSINNSRPYFAASPIADSTSLSFLTMTTPTVEPCRGALTTIGNGIVGRCPGWITSHGGVVTPFSLNFSLVIPRVLSFRFSHDFHFGLQLDSALLLGDALDVVNQLKYVRRRCVAIVHDKVAVYA